MKAALDFLELLEKKMGEWTEKLVFLDNLHDREDLADEIFDYQEKLQSASEALGKEKASDTD